QGPATGEVSTDTVAKVGDESVTVNDIRQQLNQIERNNQVPRQLESFYAQQILQNLVFQRELEYEAKRLGITVSDQERADRIRLYLPMAFNGGSFIGMDQYAALVQQRFQLTVPAFEELIRQGLLEEKFRKLVTDGISVGPAELEQEYRYNNEKIKLDYALIKPEDLEAKITPADAEIKTVGQSDAEVAETKKKAEDVLKQARKGVKFDELAKKYSEDPGSKDKGGDLGWIRQGQTVPEFEKEAFSLAPDQISDLVRTQY